MEAINLAAKLGTFVETWVPKVVGELNGQYVKVAKFEGEYVWHSHENEDELFLVVDGRIDIHFRDRVVSLAPGEFCIVPRGVEHKPVAESVAGVVLFEPATTRNTGALPAIAGTLPHGPDRRNGNLAEPQPARNIHGRHHRLVAGLRVGADRHGRRCIQLIAQLAYGCSESRGPVVHQGTPIYPVVTTGRDGDFHRRGRCGDDRRVSFRQPYRDL